MDTVFPAGFIFSQSSLQDFSDCARRFQLRYLEQLSWPAIESEPQLENEKRQLEGQQFHRLAQQHFLGLPAEKIAGLANTPNLERWWNNFLTWQRESAAPSGAANLQAEFALSVPIGNARLLAKYDLLVADETGAKIYDWKTYAKRPRNDWLSARWQTRVYRAVLTMAGAHLNGGRPLDPGQVEMIYWFADYPSEPAVFRYDQKQYKRDAASILKAVEEIASATEFPLTPDERKCNFCSYRSYCGRGIRASQLDLLESELETVPGSESNYEQISEIEF